jgi:hypothetical protein
MWATLLRAALKARYGNNVPDSPNQTFVNLGTGSFTSYHLLPTGTTNPTGRPAVSSTKNITAALNLAPDIIIVNLMSNDQNNSYTNKEFVDNCVTLKNVAEAAGVSIFFTSTAPRTFASGTSKALLRDAVPLMKSALGAARVIDIFDLLREPNTVADIRVAYRVAGDDVHYNDAGHDVIFKEAEKLIYPHIDATIKVIKRVVERAASPTGPWTVIAPNVNRTWTRYEDLTVNEGETWSYRVLDYIGTIASPPSNVATFTVPVSQPTGPLWRMLLDLGEANNKTFVGGWNNMTVQTPGSKAFNSSGGTSLTSIEGTSLGSVQFEMVNSGQNGYSVPVGTQGANVAVGDYPASAVLDYFVFASGEDNLFEAKITGLPAGSYTLKLFGCRNGVNDKREGLYSVNNGTPVVYESANTTTRVLTFNNVAPVIASGATTGEINIKIQVNTGSTYAYLNIVDLTRNS